MHLKICFSNLPYESVLPCLHILWVYPLSIFHLCELVKEEPSNIYLLGLWCYYIVTIIAMVFSHNVVKKNWTLHFSSICCEICGVTMNVGVKLLMIVLMAMFVQYMLKLISGLTLNIFFKLNWVALKFLEF